MRLCFVKIKARSIATLDPYERCCASIHDLFLSSLEDHHRQTTQHLYPGFRTRDRLARRTGRLFGIDLGMDMHRVGPVLDPFDAHLAQMTRQHTDRLLILHRDMIPTNSLGVKRCCSTPLGQQQPPGLHHRQRTATSRHRRTTPTFVVPEPNYVSVRPLQVGNYMSADIPSSATLTQPAS